MRQPFQRLSLWMRAALPVGGAGRAPSLRGEAELVVHTCHALRRFVDEREAPGIAYIVAVSDALDAPFLEQRRP